MKRIQWIAAVAWLAAAAAYGQTYEPAVPRGIPDSTPPQSRELNQPMAPAPGPTGGAVTASRPPVVPQLAMNVARHSRDVDARRCLQAGSNRQIHRCAVRYLPRGARASVKRTKAKAPATEPTAAAPRSRSASDLGKADLSTAAPAAKPIDTGKAAPPATPPTTASVIQKPSATPAPAPAEKAAAKSSDKPPKWTDTAKGVMKSRGEHLPE